MKAIIFAAHPDDAEIGMAGTIAKMTSNGYEVIICDMTQGEMGTRGTKETRMIEAGNAADILGVNERLNLKMPDGNLNVDDESVKKVVSVIRKYKPKVIFSVYFKDRHPDHVAAGEIVKKAYFLSGAAKYSDGTQNGHYRPTKLFYYPLSYEFEPDFIVDISEFIDTKMDAIKAFSTQFYNPNSGEPETLISSKMFLDYIKARCRTAGFKIRKDYGEAFLTEENIELDVDSIFIQGGK